MDLNILLYVPNIIGYVRLLLMFNSWLTYYNNPWLSFVLYSIYLLLDFVDGWTARKLKQISAFGAWLDVVIDVIGRGMLWCRLYNSGYMVACLEWLCFVCTHQLGSAWKSSFAQEPLFVKLVMANNFHTFMGMTAIGGLHVLPLSLYAYHYDILTELCIPLAIQYIILVLLAAGRILCAAVEVWFIWSHIRYLISKEANKLLNE